MDKATLKDAEAFYADLHLETEPFNVPEALVGYLLELGFSMPDAHSILCTIQVLYDAGVSIK